MRSQSAKLADDGGELSDNRSPIISGLVEAIEKALEVDPLLVILVDQLQLIEHALSLLENLADSLVVSIHADLDLNAVLVVMHDEATGVE